MMTNRYKKTSYFIGPMIGLFFLSIISLFIGTSFGSTPIAFSDIIKTFFEHASSSNQFIILHLRLPRTLCAFITGGLLALAGALMQTLLRNPLADPYILGISGGSAVAALLGILLGSALHLTLWALGGAFLSMLLVIGLSRFYYDFSSLRLLLTGIVIAAGFGAIISFILTISPSAHLRSMLFWLMGDLDYASLTLWQPLILLFGIIISLFFSTSLNILSRGELTAKSLGVNTASCHLLLYFMGSLLTATAVSTAGCIGFVGLIVPHMLRLLGTSDHRFILPGSVLLGGSLLVIADTAARTLFSPIELPVGIVTAMIGVPCFLILLQRGFHR